MSDCLIVGDFSFPTGSAAAARFRNLALGLRRHGCEAALLPLGNEPRLPWAEDHDHGIRHFPAAKAMDWRRPPPSLAGKLRWFVRSYRATGRSLGVARSWAARRPYEFMLLYGRSYVRLSPFIRWARQLGIPTILDCTEVAAAFHGLGGRLNPVYWDWRIGMRRLPMIVDGITAITTRLDRHLEDRGCRRRLLLPAVEEFSSPPSIGHGGAGAAFRLLTVSSLHRRDAPESLLAIARSLDCGGPPVTIDLVGRYESNAAAAAHIRACREDPVLRRVVRLLGAPDDRKLAELQREADGLLLTRRAAEPEEFAFPTRLVEYLRTGRPVFASAVGDIAHHLRDGVEAVLLDPHDAEAAASQIRHVAATPERGASIGAAGWARAAVVFDRDANASRLLEFARRLRAA